MRRQQLPSKSNNSKIQTKNDVMIRQNTATLYGIYFATSNTDFLLKEKKTRFSVRPSVILNEDRKTVIFDYSAVKGTDESSIFDGFFRGISVGVTLTVDGGIETTCNFINEITGVPITNFADTYTIVKTDVDKKIIIATKETGISSTTAVIFPGNHFINLPQFTKTTVSESSTPIRKILNLLPSQSLSHLGIMSGSILEFKKTSKNNNRFTVKSIYTENGIECVEVEEPITQEDATQNQIIMSVYGEEPITEGSSAPPVLPAPPILSTPGNPINHCCPCIDCLYKSIRQAESNASSRDGCDAPCTNGGRDCGPYQIDTASYIQNICGPPNAPGQPCRGGNIDGALMPACCETCTTGFATKITKVCPGGTGPAAVACCAEKKRASELLMDCFYRRFNRNPSSQCNCTGPIDHSYPVTRPTPGFEILKCCTCEDMARRHNRGPSDACDDLGRRYWEKEPDAEEPNKGYGVRYFMRQNCPTCDWEFFGPSPDPTFPGFYPSGR